MNNLERLHAPRKITKNRLRVSTVKNCEPFSLQVSQFVQLYSLAVVHLFLVEDWRFRSQTQIHQSKVSILTTLRIIAYFRRDKPLNMKPSMKFGTSPQDCRWRKHFHFFDSTFLWSKIALPSQTGQICTSCDLIINRHPPHPSSSVPSRPPRGQHTPMRECRKGRASSMQPPISIPSRWDRACAQSRHRHPRLFFHHCFDKDCSWLSLSLLPIMKPDRRKIL